MNRRSRAIGWAGFLLVLLVGGVTTYRWNIERRGKAELAAIIAEIEATDPTWTPEAHPMPPVDVTSETVVAVVGRHHKLFPEGFRNDPCRRNGRHIMEDVPPNARLDDDAVLHIENALDDCRFVRPVARRLADIPSGLRDFQPPARTPQQLPAFTGDTSTSQMRQFVELEIERLLVLGDGDRALHGVRCLCNMVLVYDHPAAMLLTNGVAIRWIEMRNATRKLERVLGMGEPRQRLADVQAAFAKEARVDYEALNRCARRAELHAFYLSLEQGDEPLAKALEAVSLIGNGSVCSSISESPEWKVRAFLYRPHLYADHAATLQHHNQLVAIGRLPTQQRHAASLALPPKSTHAFANHFTPFDTRSFRLVMDVQAQVRCAVVAIACERYRQLVGQWPATITAIPKTLLPEVPLDPYTGGSLLLKVRDDGLTVYSMGYDGKDHQGDLPDNDVGFRLYNPDQRRRAPAPVRPKRFLGGIDTEPAPPVLGPMPREVMP